MDYLSLLAPVVVLIMLIVPFVLLKLILPKRTVFDLSGKHVFVTGGSKGIGKAIAIEMSRRGASVTIVARNSQLLVEACAELKTICDLGKNPNQKAQYYALDLTKSADQTATIIRRSEEKFGPIDVLVNNAGTSVQDSFEKLPIEAFDSQMRVNYLSAVYATRAVIPGMKQRQSGRVAFVSSQAGQMGLFGYTAYSASKFALRGLAEALQMELEPHNIAVTVLYPPNTDTEGFQEELRSMPDELRLIGETSAGVYDAKQVAKAVTSDIEMGRFGTTIGSDGWMLGVLSAGGAPETSLFAAAQQILFGGLFRAMLLAYHCKFRKIVESCDEKRQKIK